MQCLKQEFCVWRISIEVNDFFTFFLLQDSTTQGTDTFEYTMTSFFKSLFHFVGCFIKFSCLSVWRISKTLFFRPWTQESPMSLREIHRVILDFLGIRNTILIIRFPLTVIPSLAGFLEEKTPMKNLKKFFTRIQLPLHRFPLHLGKTNTTWVLPLDLSIFLSRLECLSSVQHIERNQHRHILLLLPPISPRKVNVPDFLHSESLQNAPLPTSE